MPTKTDLFSGNTSYYLSLYTNVRSQSASGNYSIVEYEVRVYKTNGSGFYASSSAGNTLGFDTSATSPEPMSGFSFDFRNGSNTGNWLFKSGTFRVNHNAAGAGSYVVDTNMNIYNLGIASVNSGTINLPALAKIPDPPTVIGIDDIAQTSFRYRFSSGDDNGAPILEHQIGYGTSSSGPQKYLTSGGTSTISGLTPVTTYYVWSRSRNAVGWGPWSARSSTTTIPYTPPAPESWGLDRATQTTMRYQFKGTGNGGSTVLEWQIGYGLDPNTPTAYLTSKGESVLTGLTPGKTYYVWSRGRNAGGWGAWSARSSLKTVAGARIRVSGVWKEAVPYVRVGGVWKVAQPYVKSGDVWKITK